MFQISATTHCLTLPLLCIHSGPPLPPPPPQLCVWPCTTQIPEPGVKWSAAMKTINLGVTNIGCNLDHLSHCLIQGCLTPEKLGIIWLQPMCCTEHCTVPLSWQATLLLRLLHHATWASLVSCVTGVPCLICITWVFTCCMGAPGCIILYLGAGDIGTHVWTGTLGTTN